MSMLKKIICLGMVAVAFFSACDGSSDTMSGPDELESSSSAFSSSSSFFQQQTNPVVPPEWIFKFFVVECIIGKLWDLSR